MLNINFRPGLFEDVSWIFCGSLVTLLVIGVIFYYAFLAKKDDTD